MASSATSSSPAMLSFSSTHQSLLHSPFLATPIMHKPSLAFTKRAFNAFPTISCSSLSRSSLLLQAAKHTVDSYVKSGMVIGLGSGSASAFAIQYLGLQLRAGAVKDIVGVPTSVDSASEAAKAGIPLEQYDESSKIDLAFDDADIIEEVTLSAVIGRRTMHGGESIIQEKAILKASGKLVFIATKDQFRGALDGSVPVLIQPFNWLETAEEIDDLFLGDAEVWRRPAVGHADPLGGDFPLITRDGYNILDVIFTSPIQSLAEVGGILDKVTGVIDHGIIYKIPCTVVIASPNGVRIVDNTEMIGSSSGQS